MADGIDFSIPVNAAGVLGTASSGFKLGSGEVNGKPVTDNSGKKLENTFKATEQNYLRQIALIDTTGKKSFEVRELKILRPVDILDLLWLPAQATLADGQFQGYIPARYPLMTDATHETKLGSLTDWQRISDSLWIGRGRKMLITDKAEYALPDIRELRFD